MLGWVPCTVVSTPSFPWILHADMDAFFASVEQRDHPELRGKPVIVGATSPRGVVAAASYEARRYGVRSAMPGFRARELCPHGIYLPADISHYAAVSAEIHAVFARFTPEIEPVALDEAYLDITGSVGLFGGALAIGRELKRAVLQATELRISIGIAPTKLVAKIACSLGKPDGLYLVTPDEVRPLVERLSIRRLWGVGPVLGERIRALGIETCGDLARYPASKLREALGGRAAELQALACGIDPRPVEPAREPKSYGEENTFEVDITARDAVTATLTAHAEAVARRVRRDGYRGRTVTLKLKLGQARGSRLSRSEGAQTEPVYPVLCRSRTLAQPTDDAARLRQVAIALWDEAGIREPVRLLGVSLSNLERGLPRQLELFPDRASRLGATLDAIQERFGRGAVGPAVAAPRKITHGRQRKRGEE